jgi:glycosyltransferase involved in cell wall biosynthesis
MNKLNSQEQPKVSVYIPTKNRPAMLKRAIDSVLAQSYPNVEIVVSDDGSTDNTPEFMSALIEQHKNIIYLRSEKSHGACHARNKAILASSGKFITGLDDDDRFLPNRIEKFVEAYKDGDAFISSLAYNFNGTKFIPSHYYQKTITKNMIFRRNCVGNQIFVKKSDLIQHDIFFDEKFPAWQDYDFFTHLISKLGNAKRIYSRSYIMHTDHELERITNPKRISRGYSLYLKKYKNHMNKSQRISLAVNATLLQKKIISKSLFFLCIKYFNFYDLFKILKYKKS